MFCFNPEGNGLDPFIIFPKLVKIPGELADVPAIFVIQSSVWMTKVLFGAFCVYFVSQISKYRMDLPQDIEDEPTILIVNSFAIEYLALHNVQLLTLPSHCSHLLQLFDVAAARSLKTSMKKFQFKQVVIDVSKRLESKAAVAPDTKQCFQLLKHGDAYQILQLKMGLNQVF